MRNTIRYILPFLLFALGVLCGALFGADSVHVVPPARTVEALKVNAAIPQQQGPFNTKPTSQQIELGRSLFFEKTLSIDGTVACASCHDPKKGWADGISLAVGIQGRTGKRHSPTILNASYSPHMFWDGRTVGQPTQALLPLSNPDEMGQQSENDVLTKLKLNPKYAKLFADIMPIDPTTQSAVTGPNLAFVMAAFQSTIVSLDAPVHRRLAGDATALSPDAEIGFQVFVKADCMACHKPPLFTDNLFHNNGMEYATRAGGQQFDNGRWDVVPQRLRTNADARAFKTPTLMEIQRTAPYGHTGAFANLESVVAHYNSGGARGKGGPEKLTDARVKPLGLSVTQQAYLATFLKEGFRGKSYPMVEAP